MAKWSWQAGVAVLMICVGGCSDSDSSAPPTLSIKSPTNAETADSAISEVSDENAASVANEREAAATSEFTRHELKEDADTAVAEAKKKTAEALDSVGQAAQKKRDEYTAELKVQLRSLKERIADLHESANDLKHEAKEEFNEQAAAMADRRKDFEKKLDEMENTSVDMWVDLKSGLTAAWSQLQKAFDDASKHVNDAAAQQAAETKASGKSGTNDDKTPTPAE